MYLCAHIELFNNNPILLIYKTFLHIKKLFTLLLVLAMAIPTFASEKTVTISRNEGEYSDASTVYYAVKDGIILTMTGGMNIVITRYTDGSTTTSKAVMK